MTGRKTLSEDLLTGSGHSAAQEALAGLILRLSEAGKEIAALVARGPLAGGMSAVVGRHEDGDVQKILDRRAHDIVFAAAKEAGVAAIASEEANEPLILDEAGAYVVATDPLDGSSNIETNNPLGTLFAVLPRGDLDPASALLQPGSRQAAAGFFLYGPQTMLVLTLGSGTGVYTLDPASGELVETISAVAIPRQAAEYAINGSNARHWSGPIRSYIADCLAGESGPRGKNFNTRWSGTAVADAYRILARGGVYLYPGDGRKGYDQGRLRLLYEANPLAFLVEQAGGRATDGTRRILDIEPDHIHQHIPLVFGSADEVETVRVYLETESLAGERSPLFAKRSLFRI
jgi:fructose-1,6-bisphosphatase I